MIWSMEIESSPPPKNFSCSGIILVDVIFCPIMAAPACWFYWRRRWKHNNCSLVSQENKSSPCKCYFKLYSLQRITNEYWNKKREKKVMSLQNIFFQVWDNMIIDSALKTFYQSDLTHMIEAIQRNITVSLFSSKLMSRSQNKNLQPWCGTLVKKSNTFTTLANNPLGAASWLIWVILSYLFYLLLTPCFLLSLFIYVSFHCL